MAYQIIHLGTGNCPTGFQEYDNHCYALIKRPVAWVQAQVGGLGRDGHGGSRGSGHEQARPDPQDFQVFQAKSPQK